MSAGQIDFLEDGLLSVEQLALMLHKTPASVRSDASRNQKSLPPICRLPGSKRLYWRRQDVVAWIARFVEGSPSKDFYRPASSAAPRGRGRPRKMEVVG